MTIDEAIEIKKKHQHWLPKESYPEFLEADNLSIEALKHLQALRKYPNVDATLKLPSET